MHSSKKSKAKPNQLISESKMPLSLNTAALLTPQKITHFSSTDNQLLFSSPVVKNFSKPILNFLFAFFIISLVLIWEIPTIAKEIPKNNYTESTLKEVENRLKTSGFSKLKRQENLFFRKVVKNQDIQTLDDEEIPEIVIVKKLHPDSVITMSAEVLLPQKLQKPLKIMIMGDSMIQEDLGIFLENQLTKLGFATKRVAKYSTGLTNRKYFDWEAYAQKQLIEYNPEVAIAMFGANDGQNITGRDGLLHRYGTAGWNDSYAQNVRAFLQVNSKLVKKFYLFGHPIAGNPEFREKLGRINSIFESVSAEFSNVVFVKTWDRFAVNGNYSAVIADKNGFRSRVKYDDGVHVNGQGSKIMFEVLQPEMEKDIVF